MKDHQKALQYFIYSLAEWMHGITQKKGVETDNGFEGCLTAKISGKPFFSLCGREF